MAGIVLDPVNSVEDIERNLKRLNEAIVAMQGGSIAMENIVGYENLATKDDLADEVKNLQGRHDFQIGDLYFSLDKENPKEKLGYGDWELVAQGRAITGVDTKFLPDGAIDPDYEADEDFKSPEKTGGTKTHKLTIEQMPKHTHKIKEGSAGPGGSEPDKLASGDDFTHTTAFYSTSSETGGDQPHPIMQPYYCTYIWRRTA